ncbi:MAG: hypothetical protein K9J37_01765 [Saprospiraceae bacterium]|nr:hypothetical protein [Saprospiraceae bacterium]MCF8248604.1 hypothetical protein [Saprospiraceae bacterium]MCF8281042.1 hypothetical protein [Bacteroidales bacterium]MCF8310337.1 hypothetical protein [Saprospiraceae bacterium]MCF8442082.1 hypothetical protein [Saprospiraceae bacterium]
MNRTLTLLVFLFLSDFCFCQHFFCPNPSVSVTEERINVFLTEFPEIEAKVSLYNLSKPVFQTILIVQSNAGYSIADRRFNYGRVIPNERLKNFSAFAASRNGVVACSQRSSGLEAVALSLHFLRSNKKKALSDAKWLTLVFGPDGDLSSLAKEADMIYSIINKKNFKDLGLGFGVMSNDIPTDEFAASLPQKENSAIEEPNMTPVNVKPSHPNEPMTTLIRSELGTTNKAKHENVPIIKQPKQNTPIVEQAAIMHNKADIISDSAETENAKIFASENILKNAEKTKLEPEPEAVTAEKGTATGDKTERRDISGTYSFYGFENCNYQKSANEIFNSKTGHNSKKITIAGSNMFAEQINTPYEITKVNDHFHLKHTNILKVTRVDNGTINVTKVEGAGDIKIQDNKYVLFENRVYTNSVADLKHLNELVAFELIPLPNNRILLRPISTDMPKPIPQDSNCSLIMEKQ